MYTDEEHAIIVFIAKLDLFLTTILRGFFL